LIRRRLIRIAFGKTLLPKEFRTLRKLMLLSYRHSKRVGTKRAPIVRRAEISRDLIRLGVKAGDILFVNSSMSSIGRVLGGPDEVIDAIEDVLTPAGTLVMPAFPQPHEKMLSALQENEIFDSASTTSTLGQIPESFRRRTGVLRSLHPTCPVYAFGARADLITGAAKLCGSNWSLGTPLYKIKEHGGKILGLGVESGPVSLYHVIASVLVDRFPLRVGMEKVLNAKVVEDGKSPLNLEIPRTRIERNPWLQELFREFLIDRGVLRIGRVGQARSWMIDAQQLFESQMELMKRGITIYTTRSEYDSTKQRLISLVVNYRSAFSDSRHNYLEEQVSQIARPHEMKGFWDSSSNNWIRLMKWTGADWRGFMPHDWKYAIEMQEGATQYALLTGSTALDPLLRGELEYIHSKIRRDGSVIGIPDGYPYAPKEYEYGLVLSALALGYMHFARTDPAMADKILRDLDLLYNFMTDEFNPTFDDPFSVILRAYANLLSIYKIRKATDEVHALKQQVAEYANEFMRHQAGNGLFPFDSSEVLIESRVHAQLKADIALLLCYKVTSLERYLVSAAKNLAWVTKHLTLPNGAVKWDLDNDTDFFEIHQMLLLIAYKYAHDLSEGRYDYTQNSVRAWKFLLEENSGYVDMYVRNLNSTGAFFSFRHIDNKGDYQKGVHGSFKGSYEIGTSLWALALNKNLAL